MLTCLLAVAERVFHDYLSLAEQRKNDEALEEELVSQAQFLLVKFNHILKEVCFVLSCR